MPVRILLARAAEVACAVTGQSEIAGIEQLLPGEEKRRMEAAQVQRMSDRCEFDGFRPGPDDQPDFSGTQPSP
jgi:hypothetical protein